MRQVNDAGVKLITKEEGFSPVIYDDCGKKAIGFGHDLLPGEHFDEPMSREDAVVLFQKDCTWRERMVEGMVKVTVSDNQFSALVSLFYNIGEGHFQTSTVLRLLNQGDYQGAAEAFKMWHYKTIDGKTINAPELVKRREDEIALFNTPDDPQPAANPVSVD